MSAGTAARAWGCTMRVAPCPCVSVCGVAPWLCPRAGGAGRCRGLRPGCRAVLVLPCAGSAGVCMGGSPTQFLGAPSHVVRETPTPCHMFLQGRGLLWGRAWCQWGWGSRCVSTGGWGARAQLPHAAPPLVPCGCAVPGAGPQARAAVHWSWPQGAGGEGPGCPGYLGQAAPLGHGSCGAGGQQAQQPPQTGTWHSRGAEYGPRGVSTCGVGGGSWQGSHSAVAAAQGGRGGTWVPVSPGSPVGWDEGGREGPGTHPSAAGLEAGSLRVQPCRWQQLPTGPRGAAWVWVGMGGYGGVRVGLQGAAPARPHPGPTQLPGAWRGHGAGVRLHRGWGAPGGWAGGCRHRGARDLPHPWGWGRARGWGPPGEGAWCGGAAAACRAGSPWRAPLPRGELAQRWPRTPSAGRGHPGRAAGLGVPKRGRISWGSAPLCGPPSPGLCRPPPAHPTLLSCREPPDRRPSPASLQAPRQRPAPLPLRGDPPGPQPPAPPQPAGGPRRRPLVPRHGPRLTPRHGPRPAPRHGPKLAPRHGAPRHPVARRGRRHAGGRLHHAQLLRVGCVLGTCQVQNLSHLLWQLRGQSGRQDSSPMNPNSPHSYG